MLKLQTLGGLAILDGDRPLEIQSIRKPLAILACVAAARDVGVSRDRLQALFWPESDGDRARSGLKQALYLSRRALGVDPFVSRGLHLAIDSTALETDLATFQHLLNVGESAAAIDCYGGPFLDGVYLKDLSDFEHWVESERARLAGLFAGALEQLARVSHERGNHVAAAGSWRRRSELDPLDGRVALEYLHALANAGAREQALRFAQVHTALVRQELGVPADARIAAYREELAAALPAPTSTPRPAMVAEARETDGARDAALYSAASSGHTKFPLAPRHIGNRRRVIAAGVALLAVIGLLSLQGYNRIRDGARPKMSFVLATPRIVGADTSLSGVMLVALATSLDQSNIARVVDTRTVVAALTSMRRDTHAEIDSAAATEVAFRTGAAGAVMTTVQRAGDGYLLSARIFPRDGSSPVPAQESAADNAKLVAAIVALGADLRRALGERSAQLRDRVSLLGALTPSLEALRAYSAGLDEGGFDRMHSMERAVEIDSNFAAAWIQLLTPRQGLALDWITPLERVRRLIDRLPRDQGLEVEGEAAQHLTRDLVSARGAYETALALPSEYSTPRDRAYVQHLLSLVFLELGRPREAIALADSAFAADPRLMYYGNRALAAAQLGASSPMFRRAMGDLATRPVPVPRGWGEEYIYADAHDWRVAVEQMSILLANTSDPARQFTGLKLAGTIEAVRGRPAASRAAFTRALSLARQAGHPEWVDAVSLEQADVELHVLRDTTRAAASLRPVLHDSAGIGVRRRARAAAGALVVTLCSTTTRYDVCSVGIQSDSADDEIEFLERAGWQALARGQLADAERLGRRSLLARSGLIGLAGRTPAAMAFEQEGMLDSARAIYEPLTGGYFGDFTLAPRVLVMRSYALQRLAELGGLSAERARADLARDWIDAEPEFRAHVAARFLSDSADRHWPRITRARYSSRRSWRPPTVRSPAAG